MRRLAFALLILAIAALTVGCDNPPQTYYQLGDGHYTYWYPVAGAPAGQGEAAVMEKVSQVGSVITWRATVTQFRGNRWGVALYSTIHDFEWQEDGTAITRIIYNSCGYQVWDEASDAIGIGGVAIVGPCTLPSASQVLVGARTADLTPTWWHLQYEIAPTPPLDAVRQFWPHDSIVLHAHDSTHGGSSYFTGWEWNG